MVADALGEASNSIVSSLPTAAQFSAFVPSGYTLDGSIVLTQANAKALGIIFPGADATITFSSTFAFDYDNSNGVDAGLLDFETVAAHEIGHALGFISGVDAIDGTSPHSAYLTPLDLFRFQASTVPGDAAQFTTTPRFLVPGGSAVFNDTENSWALSTGLTQGDGRQASHWKDDALTGNLIGVMDPTLSNGFQESISAADLRAFDLIGYDLAPVPEPSSFALMGSALVLLSAAYRRRQHT
jgi:hypothetical protein